MALGHRRLSIVDALGRRAPADDLRRRPLRRLLQRRDLQRRRVARRARGRAATGSGAAPTPKRSSKAALHGASKAASSGSSGCSPWRSGTARRAGCPSCATGSASSRSTGRSCDRRPALRLRAQGVARASGLDRRARSRRARRLSAARLLRRARARSIASPQAAEPRLPDDGRRVGIARDQALLASARLRARGGAARCRAGRASGGRPPGRPAARCRRPPDGRRRPGRIVPLGRDRFLPGDRADAGCRRRPGADLLDRLSRGGPRRGGPCARGGAAPRHRPHGALRRRARGAGRDPRASAVLRRALCRRLPDRQPAARGRRPARRRRGLVGRWRRRDLHRLSPLRPDRAALAPAGSARARGEPGRRRRRGPRAGARVERVRGQCRPRQRPAAPRRDAALARLERGALPPGRQPLAATGSARARRAGGPWPCHGTTAAPGAAS